MKESESVKRCRKIREDMLRRQELEREWKKAGLCGLLSIIIILSLTISYRWEHQYDFVTSEYSVNYVELELEEGDTIEGRIRDLKNDSEFALTFEHNTTRALVERVLKINGIHEPERIKPGFIIVPRLVS